MRTLAIRTSRGFVAVHVSQHNNQCTIDHSRTAQRLTGCGASFVGGTGYGSIARCAADGNAHAFRTLRALREEHPAAVRGSEYDT